MQPAELEPLRTWLLESTGLQADLLGRQRLQWAVKQRLEACRGETLQSYRQRFFDDPAEQQCLIEALVVGESWFLREGRSFDQLVELARRQRQRPLRVLSCGCSSGEEPYSVVIALLEAGIAPQQLEVVAIDISALALARAAEGLYSSHSLRGMEPRCLQRYFDPEGKRWRLRQEIREAVNFRRGALQLQLNSLESGWHAVFCRNVMLYLHDQARRDLLLTIAERLDPAGLLLVAAAEAPLVPTSHYRRLQGGHGAGFVPLVSPASPTADAPSQPSALPASLPRLNPPRSWAGPAPTSGDRGPIPSQSAASRLRPSARPFRFAAPDAADPVGSRAVPSEALPAKAGGSQGVASTARDSNAAGLAHPAAAPTLEPERHFEAAVQLQQLGRSEQALAALRRCLYLNPAHRGALTLRAQLADQLGRHDEAEQVRRRLARVGSGGEP